MSPILDLFHFHNRLHCTALSVACIVRKHVITAIGSGFDPSKIAKKTVFSILFRTFEQVLSEVSPSTKNQKRAENFRLF